MKKENNPNWIIESLRFTSFLKNDFNSNHLEKWLKEISQNDPLSINKSINYFQGLVTINSSILKLEWNFNRIDLILSSNFPPIENSIGHYSDIKQLMENIFLKFFTLEDCPNSKRIALGIILKKPIKEYDEGVDFLQTKLKSIKDLKGTSDFLFRINKPLNSKSLDGLRLNRLMTWSIGNRPLLNIAFLPSQPNLSQQNALPTNEMTCRLEMDFNNIEDEKIEMIADQQKTILLELLDHALKVAEKGEHWITK